MGLKASFCGISLPSENVSNPAIEKPPLPQKAILPLGHGREDICEPVVAVGEQVKTGQLIGRSTGFLTAPVHSPLSGRVMEIRPWFDQRGGEVLSIVIEGDGKDTWVEGVQPNEFFMEKEPAQILSDLRVSGVVEGGSSAKPLHAKFGRPEPSREFLFLVGTPIAKPLDTIIINGIDAEPGMAAKGAVLDTHGSEIIAGIKIFQKLMGSAQVVLAVSANASLNASVSGELAGLGVSLFQGKDKYPLGLNPILIKCVTGREIPLPNGTEQDVGVAVVDATALVNVVEAVRDLKPQVEKVVSVSGGGMPAVKNLKVRLGTRIRDLMDHLDIKGEPIKVIAGGAMTGVALLTTEVPITKETEALIFQTAGEAASFSSDACINCGICVRHCPARLLPNELSKYCEFGMFDYAKDKFLLHCIECGICAYVCPEKRPMLHLMRYGKRELSLG